MKLYYFPGSCALAPHIVLEWVNAEFQPIKIEKGDPEYLKVNPLGVVPALEWEGQLYFQADAILHFLAELHPDFHLDAQGSPESKYELNYWMSFLTGDLHPAFYPFFGPHRFTSMTDSESIAAAKAASQQRVAGFLNHMDRHLKDKTFLVGEKRSIADAYAIPMLRWVRLLDQGLDSYGALSAYLSYWENDQGVQRALNTQGLN